MTILFQFLSTEKTDNTSYINFSNEKNLPVREDYIFVMNEGIFACLKTSPKCELIPTFPISSIPVLLFRFFILFLKLSRPSET